MKALILTLALTVSACSFVYSQDKKSVVIGTMIDKPNAILIINPPNGDQGFLLPQLTSAQRLSIAPASPGDDGLVVFDTTEKSFYYWSGNAWIKGLGVKDAQVLSFDESNQTLSLSNGGGQVELTTLKEIPPLAANQDAFLTTDGTTLKWTNISSLGDITSIVAGQGLTGGGTTGDIALKVNTDGSTIGFTATDQLHVLDNAVSSPKIQNNAVTSSKIPDGAVTPSKIQASSTNNQVLVTVGGTVAWVDQNTLPLSISTDGSTITGDGSAGNPLSVGVISPTDISATGPSKVLVTDGTGLVNWSDQSTVFADDQNLTFTGNTLSIANGNSVSLTANGQVAGALDNLTIQNDVVTSAHLATNAVDGAAIQADAVNSSKIQDNSVTVADINSAGNDLVLATDGAGVVTWTPRSSFVDDNQGLTLVAGNTLNIDNGTAANLNALTAGGQIQGTLDNLSVVDGTITPAKIQSSGPNQVLITNGAGAAGWADQSTVFNDDQNLTFAGNSLTIDNGNSVTLAATGDVAGALDNLTIQNDVVTSAHLATNAVDAAAIQADAVNSSKIQDNSIAPSDINSAGTNKVLITDGAGTVTWSDRSTFTDDQTVTFAGNTLTIENGNSVILSGNGDVAGTLDNLTLQNDVVTSAHLATNAVDAVAIQADAVNSSKIQDNSITPSDMNSAGINKVLTTDGAGTVAWSDRSTFTDDQTVTFTGNTLSIENGNSVDLAATGQVAGDLDNLTIQNDVVTSAHLATNAVDAAAIQADAVNSSKIQDNSIAAADINSVGNNKVLSTDGAGVVTWSDRSTFTDDQNLTFAGNTLSIENGNNVDLAATGQVAGDLDNLTIQNDVVTSAHLATNAVDAVAIQADAVNSSKIQDGTVATVDINSGGNSKVLSTDGTGVVIWADRSTFADNQNLSLSGGNILSIDRGASTVDLNDINATGPQIQGNIDALAIVDNTVTSADIANGTITTNDIEDESITGNDIDDGTISSADILDGSIVPADINSGGNNKVLTTTAGGAVGWTDQSALPIAGDVTGTLAATTVARLQGRNVSNAAPTNGQTLIWNNATSTWVPGPIVATPVTQYYAVDPVDFQGTGSPISVGIHLPDGAIVTNVTVYYQYLLVGSINTTFSRKAFATAATQTIASGASPLISLGAISDVDLSNPVNNVIDNSTYSYRIQCSFTLVASSAIQGISIEYTK